MSAMMLAAWTSYAFLLLGLLASALMAGFFYAYSVSVMRGLDATEPLAAALAMRNINALIRTPVFFFGFFGALAFPLPLEPRADAGLDHRLRPADGGGRGRTSALIGV